MRIAVFSDNFYPEISGITDTIIMAVRELAKRGHYINVYAPYYSAKNYKFLNLSNKELNLGKRVNIIRLPSIPYKTGTGQGRAVIPLGFSLMSVKKFKPDVIHVHLPFGVGLEGVLCAKLLGIPLVGTNHTPMSEFLKYSPIESNLIKNIVSRYNHWFFGRCNFISSPANAIFNESPKSYSSILHRAVPNPADLSMFKPAASKKKKYGLSDFVILYSGRLAPEKHVEDIVHALTKLVKKVPKAMFAVTGRGASEGNLKELAKKLGIEKSIKFFGFLSVKDLAEIYNSSDVFVIMSTADSQSLAAMQAMASGIPVIGADACGLPEYINKDNGFIVKPGDTTALYRKLLFLHENSKERKKLGLGGIKFAATISPRKNAERWEKVYKEAIEAYKKPKK